MPPEAETRAAVFHVHLANFEGPFDLLLGLIAKHQLDVTAVALSQVTDEFLACTRAPGAGWDLGQTTEFLLVAATLLDLKAARLLPAAEVEDEEDLALLEARDLLFARLLQYRAYKQVSALFAQLLAAQSQRYPRAVGLEARFARLLPEIHLGVTPAEFAAVAARVLSPRPPPVIDIDHVHRPAVDVAAHTAVLRERLAQTDGGSVRAGSFRAWSFRALTADCTAPLEVIARFLGLLDLYREGVVSFEQMTPLGDLHVRWCGAA